MSSADVGEVRALFIADVSLWEPGLNKIEASLAETKRGVEADMVDMQGSISRTNASLSSMIDQATQTQHGVTQEMSAMAVKASGAMAGVTVALSGVAASLQKSRDASKAIMREMKGAFGDHAAEMSKIAQEQLAIGIDPKKAADALVSLNKFGQATETNLKMIEDAAAHTGRSMDGMAGKVGKAFQDLSTPATNASRSVAVLQKEIGASSADLQKLGAKLDENNKVLADTPARAAAAKAALEQYMNSNFAGSAERMASASMRLKGEMELLKREVAAGAETLSEQMAPAQLKVIQYMRSFSPEAKAMVGTMVQTGQTFASVATTGLAMGSQIALIGQNATACAIATRAWAAATALAAVEVTAAMAVFAGVIVVIGAVAFALNETTKAIEAETKATEEAIKIDERRARGLKENIDVLGKTADEVRKLGKSADDVRKAIEGLQNQAEAARAAGNKALEARLKEQIAAAQKVKAELAQGDFKEKQKDHQDGIDAPSRKEQQKLDRERRAQERKAKADAARDQKLEFDQALGHVHQLAAAKKIAKDEEIAMLQDVMLQHNATAHQRLKVEQEIAKLKGQIDGDASKKAALERQEEYKHILALGASKRISHQQEIDMLMELVNKHHLTGKERMAIEQKVAQLKGQLETEHTKAHAKEEANRKKEAEKHRTDNLKEAIAHIDEEMKARRISVQDYIDGLKRIRSEMAKTANEKRSLDLKVSTVEGKVKSGEIRDEKAEAHQAEKDKDELVKLGKSKAAAQEREIDSNIKALEDRHKESGVNTTGQITSLYNQRLQLQINEINAEKRRVQEKTKNAEVIKAAEQDAQAKIREAHAETTRKIHEEVEKQKAIHASKNQSAMAEGPYDLAALGAQQAATFGGAAVNARIAEIRAQNQASVSPQALSNASPLAGYPAQQGNALVSQSAGTQAMGKATEALKEALSIVVNIHQPGQPTRSQTFTGNQSDLAKADNVFRAGSTPGRL